MEKYDRFLLIAGILGFIIDLGTLTAFFVQVKLPNMGIESGFLSWFAILSILTLFYGTYL